MEMTERQAAWASLRMVANSIEEILGPIADMESDEATLLRGPEYHHRAEAIINSIQRTCAEITRLRARLAEAEAAKADAWDEGYWAGHSDGASNRIAPDNPYRSKTDG